MSDMNKIYPSLKFEYKYLQAKTEILDVLLYKNHNNILQTKL